MKRVAIKKSHDTLIMTYTREVTFTFIAKPSVSLGIAGHPKNESRK